MEYKIDFSVIVPCYRGAVHYLPKLLSSIPEKDGIEVIVVDNSTEPLSREEIYSQRDIILLHSAPERHAGGSRNDGIDVAHGKWLLFADADDYFTENAFDVFYSKIDSQADIIYTEINGVYIDTGKRANRGDRNTQLVKDFLSGKCTDIDIRLSFVCPVAQMFSTLFIRQNNIKYDEIKASNDVYFSKLCGIKANKIEAIDTVTYIATVNRGSLTQRRDYEVIKARLYASLRCNQLLKANGYRNKQSSIMYFFTESRHYGFSKMLEFLWMIIKYHQNPFVGCSRWFSTYKKVKKRDVENAKYIVR